MDSPLSQPTSNQKPRHDLVEVLRVAPHNFKVSSLKFTNADEISLLYGKRNDLFLVVKEGDTRTLFARGNNHYGECGTGNRRRPVRDLEEVFSVKNSEITCIRSGGRHSLFVLRKDSHDELFACGYNSYSQCCIPTDHEHEDWVDVEDSDTEDEDEFITSWTKAEWPPKKYAKHSASASQQSQSSTSTASSNNKLTDEWRIKLMDCGACHTIVVTETNRIFVRGYGEWGQLGLNNTKHQFQWKELKNKHLKGEEIRHVVAECFSTFILTASNNLYTCGFNSKGKCGVGGQSDCLLVPTRITYPFSTITHLDAGEDHILVVTEGKNLYASGSNRHYECGFSENHNRYSFEKVDSNTIEEIGGIDAISCGVNNSLIVSRDGKIRPFGDFFSSLDANEFISLHSGYLRFITMLDDRFVFIRSTEESDATHSQKWEKVKPSPAHNKKFVTQGVEASIPTPVDVLRRSNFPAEDAKKGDNSMMSPRKRAREDDSRYNEEVQVRIKKRRATPK